MEFICWKIDFEKTMAACVNGNGGERLIVKAVYKFKASNNDEVSLH